MRWKMFASAFLLGVPAFGYSQVPPLGCGEIAEAKELLPRVADEAVALDVDQSRRASLGPWAEYVVADLAVCRRVYAAAAPTFRRMWGTSIDATPLIHDFAVFRIGPYYAFMVTEVMERSTDPSRTSSRGRALIVLSVTTLQPVGAIGP
jgi:hypothetical protein